MKVSKQCYPCLTELLYQAAELATADPALRAKAIEQGMLLLEQEFSPDKVSVTIATPIHRLVRSITENDDPYFRMKDAEMRMALALRQEWQSETGMDLKNALMLAVRGNTIDFFKDIGEIREEMSQSVIFAVDDTEKLEKSLHKARSILYLADNSGEALFDIPLVSLLNEYADTTYVVKGSPIQNDITLAELQRYDLIKEFKHIITTGTDTPGVIMELASDEFLKAYDAADVILAKGMGYWETQSELPAEGKVFHLLKAKCQPVADSLNVALNDYIALLR